MWSQLAAAATRGPWRVSFNGYSVKSETDEQPIVAAVPGAAGATGGVFARWLVDAEFMARAREAVPALLTELAAAEAQVTRLEEGLRHMAEQAGEESCAGYLARAVREERRAVEAERELAIQAGLRHEQNALIIRLENERAAAMTEAADAKAARKTLFVSLRETLKRVAAGSITPADAAEILGAL
jgi:hypothetical protein